MLADFHNSNTTIISSKSVIKSSSKHTSHLNLYIIPATFDTQRALARFFCDILYFTDTRGFDLRPVYGLIMLSVPFLLPFSVRSISLCAAYKPAVANYGLPYVIGQTIIFSCCFFLLSFFFFPRLISAVRDWMFTILWYMVWP